LATVMAYDDVEGAPVRTAANSGYVRLACGATTLVCDIRPTPARSPSTRAHAGFLSFEMSSANCPMIVNCGAPAPDHDAWRPYSRSTAAHSTLTFEDSLSAGFAATGADGGVNGGCAAVTGPT